MGLLELTKSGFTNAIQFILAKKASFLTPRQLLEEESYYKDFERRLVPRFISAESKISADVLNRNLEALYIALNGLDGQVTDLYQRAQTHYLLTDSELSKAKAALKSALIEAQAFSLQRQYPDYDTVVIDKLDANHTNRQPAAAIDPSVRILRAGAADYKDSSVVDYLPTTSTASVTFYGGGVESGLSAVLPLKYMLDYHDGTAWADSLLSEGPISVERGDTTYHGPIAEIVVEIAIPQPANFLRLLPFSFFPQYVLSIDFKSSASAEEWEQLPGFSPFYLEDLYELYFETRSIALLRLVLVQEHYKQLVISVPKDSIRRAAALSAILDARNQAIAGLAEAYVADSTKPYYEAASEELGRLFTASQGETWSKRLRAMSEAIVQELGERSEETETVSKLEYLFGLRSLDLGYLRYTPVSYYESEEFLPGSTISTVELHVSGQYPGLTSAEWYLDFGQDRVVPILPKEAVSGSVGLITHEVLDVSLAKPYDYTRFPVTGSWQVFKNGQPMETGTYSGTSGDYLKITITDPVPSDFYTVSYLTPSSSSEIDVLDTFSSRQLDAPEVFTDTGPDNDIELSLYPYVAYEIINDTGDFAYDSVHNNWVFQRPGYLTGQGMLRLFPRVLDSYGHILISGQSIASGIPASFGPRSGQSAPDFSTAVSSIGTGYFEPPYGYYFGIERFPRAFSVTGVSGSVLYLDGPPTFTTSEVSLFDSRGFSGSLTGAPYSAQLDVPYYFGVGLDLDGTIYGFEAGAYTPITVTVAGEPAVNNTDYETLEHRAFDSNKGTYEFIHAGRKIYFNQPIHGKTIEVDYKWVTKYMKIVAALRAGGTYKPQDTPTISSIYALLDTTVL